VERGKERLIRRSPAAICWTIVWLYGIYGPFLESGGATSGIWWRYRQPGFGVVDWHKYADILAEIGYQGPMNIEHEDQVWGFTQDVPRMHEGLLVAKRYLEQTLI
jgi:sugar phosphate isomerase/epimerase